MGSDESPVGGGYLQQNDYLPSPVACELVPLPAEHAMPWQKEALGKFPREQKAL